MKQTSILATLTIFALLSALAVSASAQETHRPRAPMLTNDDVLSPRSSHPLPEESVVRTTASGSPLRNPRAVIENALIKMSEVTSLRTRMQTSLPAGQREILLETVKPDRTHIVSSDGEMILIGRKFYMKRSGGDWQLTSMPAAPAQSDSGFDFRSFVKQMTSKPGVRITGQMLGNQTIDGVEAIAYEFEVTDGSESGTVHLSVGKEDGYMRRMFVSGGALSIKIWFTNINEQLSIEPPM